ncbi:hypothetical protein GC170_00720 [bacterium]|nr:hypothetical protein [bacterium]
MNNGLRASGGFAQPGANSMNYQKSMQHIRGGAPGGTGARTPGTQANAANRNANLRNDPAARRDVEDRNPVEDAATRNEPFSRDWYGAHPDAWRYDHPDADAYAFAGAPGMYNWWGASAGRGAVPVGGGGAAPVVQGTPAPAAANPANAAPADAGTEPNGAADANAAPPGDWLPLGVFSLTHDNTPDEVTRAIQLATNKSGELKGNQIDLLTDTTAEVHGRYEAETKTLHWTIGKSNGVVFTAKVDDFGKAGKPIPVLAHYSNGSSARWIMTPAPKSGDSDDKAGE